jgi:hypothetical protein
MAAVLLLGAGTLYMMAQQARFSELVHQTVKISEQEESPPHGELSASVIRGAKKVSDSIKYGDMNERLPTKEKEMLYEQEVQTRQEAASWDAPAFSSPIEGVLLQSEFSS